MTASWYVLPSAMQQEVPAPPQLKAVVFGTPVNDHFVFCFHFITPRSKSISQDKATNLLNLDDLALLPLVADYDLLDSGSCPNCG